MVDQKRRVRVYRLNGKEAWIDSGTGHVSCINVERLGGTSILVRSEEDGRLLIESRIVADDIYQLQQDTLIVWREPDTGENLALSFQDRNGCSAVWDRLVAVQKKIAAKRDMPPSPQLTGTGHPQPHSNDPNKLRMEPGEAMIGAGEPSLSETDDSDIVGPHPAPIAPVSIIEHVDDAGMSLDEGDDSSSSVFPPCELANLKEISSVLMSVNSLHRRDRVATAVLQEGFLPKLIDLFRVNEDLENVEDLHVMFDIAKGLIMLNESSVLDHVLRNEVILDVIGMLEYDAGLKEKQGHREFLTKTALFKEAVPIRDPVVISRIHQTFRVQYIKDVVLPRILDDSTFASLNSLIFFNHIDIVRRLKDNDAFLTELFEKANADTTTVEERRDVMQFLQEFTGLARSLLVDDRNDLYKTLSDHGLFQLLLRALAEHEPRTQLSAIEVLTHILQHDSSLIRTFMLAERKAREFLPEKRSEQTLASIITDRFLRDEDGGVRGQLTDCFRTLLDSVSMGDSPQKTEFLNLFYEECMPSLVAPVASAAVTYRKTHKESGGGDVEGDGGVAPELFISIDMDKEDDANLISQVIDVLSYCILHHSYHIKNHIIRNHVAKDVVVMMRSKHSHLVLSAIRFLRTVIGMRDEFYNRQIIKHSLLGPVMEVFVKHKDRYNLLNSAVLDLIVYVRQENIKSLVAHICETYAELFRDVKYVDCFEALMLKHMQNSESALNGTVQMEVDSNASLLPRPSELHREFDERQRQDDWFESDDDSHVSTEPNSAHQSPNGKPPGDAFAVNTNNNNNNNNNN
eukprot:Opistho-2@85989